MINAGEFIEAARGSGIRRYVGVPCSFLASFIDHVIADDTLAYVSAANEGDALAIAAGASIGGQPSIVMMQNSGLGNAVSPITSLAWVFRIPMIIIVTQRGAPGVADEPQHELMGQITGSLLELMQVPWEVFPDHRAAIRPALQRALDYMRKERRPYGFVMGKGAVMRDKPEPNVARAARPCRSIQRRSFATSQERIGRREALERIVHLTPEAGTVVIATTGFSGRELFAIADRPNQLYMVGSMGCASSLGLGLALARPDLQVVVIDGDGAALMRMGNFATIGSYGGDNFIHILLDNEAHDSTGGQATVAANVRFADIAAACAYAASHDGNDARMLDELFSPEGGDGPRFAHLKIRTGAMENLPRPDIVPADALRRLMRHIGSHVL